MSQALSELDRRLGNLIRLGSVTELDAAKARVKVDIGDVVTDWLPWVTARAGSTRTWSAPRAGEQVIILAPSGELSQGAVLPSIFQDAHPAPADSQDVERTIFPDGSVVEYDSATSTLTVTVAAAGNVVVNCKAATINAADTAQINTKAATIKASSSTRIDSPTTTVTGAMTVEGLFTYKAGMSGSGGSGAVLTGDFRAQNGAFTHNGKNVGSDHRHTGVQTGSGSTGAPA